MSGVDPNTVVALTPGAGRGQATPTNEMAFVAQAAMAAHSAETRAMATEVVAAGDRRALVAEGNSAIAATQSMAAQAITHAQAGREVDSAWAQAGAAVTQAQAGREVDSVRAQAGLAVTQAQAGRDVDAARNQAGILVNEAEAKAKLAKLEARHHAEVSALQAQLELEKRTARLSPTKATSVPNPVSSSYANSGELANLRQRVREETEKAELEAQLRRLVAGNEGPPATGGGGGDDAQPEMGPLMGGLSSIDVDAWWGGGADVLPLVHVHQREHYRELLEAKAGTNPRPQAHEAQARLRELGMLMSRLPAVESLEDAERLLADLAKANVARLEVLREGVTGGGWTSAQEMEDAHFVAPAVPPFLRAMWGKKGKAEKTQPQRNPATKSRH